MKNYQSQKINKSVILTLFVVVFAISYNISLTQEKNDKKGDFPRNKEHSYKSPKKKERLNHARNTKMMQFMGIAENKQPDLIAKLNNYDVKMTEQRRELRSVNKKLHQAIKENKRSEMQTLSNSILEIRENLNMINSEKTREMKSILSEVEFAKYIHFENAFMKEYFNRKMDGKKKWDKEGNHEHKKKNRSKTE